MGGSFLKCVAGLQLLFFVVMNGFAWSVVLVSRSEFRGAGMCGYCLCGGGLCLAGL